MKNTIVLKVDPLHPDAGVISRAAGILRSGGLVAFPTETVYGLGANALDKGAVARLYGVKNRPGNKPFTVQVSDAEAVENFLGCELTKDASALIGKFWPGPLTLVLKSGKGDKVGFRIPKNNIALSLLREVKIPVYVPSANPGGNKPPTTAGGVLNDLDGKIDLVLDGGPADVGVESTVIDMTVTPPKILREGAVSREILAKIIDL